MEFNDFLNKLENVKKGAGDNQYTARCPAHDDQVNSLSVSFKSNKILIHCHAGCDIDKILKALGMQKSALSSEYTRKVEAEYLYKDLSGIVRHKTIRYNPKWFSQARPDGKGGWINNLNGVDTILYNLRGVTEAIKQGETVYLVEGEKDTDNLIRLGLTATTSPMGAGKWKPRYTETLKEGIIVIIPDNDKPGHEHAYEIANGLSGKAKSIKVVDLKELMPNIPEKGDISDYIKFINKDKSVIENLNNYLKNKAEWQVKELEDVKTICFADVEETQIRSLWDPYIPSGKITLIQGDPAKGKTTLAIEIASIVSRGLPFPLSDKKEINEPGNVIYQTAEDGIADTIKPRLRKMRADFSRIHIIDETDEALTLSDKRIENSIRKLKPKLIIIDPLQAYLGSYVDMHRANQVRPVLQRIGNLAQKYDCAIIFIMHLSKMNQTNPLYKGLGSVDIPAIARSILVIGSNPEDNNERVLVQVKNSFGKNGDSLAFEIDSEQGLRWKGRSFLSASAILGGEYNADKDLKIETAKDFLYELLSSGEEISAKEISSRAYDEGISKKTLERAKKELNIKSARIGFGQSSFVVWRMDDSPYIATDKQLEFDDV